MTTTPGTNLTFLMLATHNKAALTLGEVCNSYFDGMTEQILRRKIRDGEIPLPLVYLDPKSQKGPVRILVTDLAAYIHKRQEEAVKAQGLAH